MNTDNKISRRDFIKTSVVTGGALLASTVIPGQAMNLLQDQKNDDKFTYNELLKGVCDIHLHCRPDSRERSVDEYSFMKDAMAAGYRAVMFKSNDFSCHDRAYIIRQALPGAECFGSFCMNRVHGDKVNVFAAQKAVETSGGLCRCIWMPTLDAVLVTHSDNDHFSKPTCEQLADVCGAFHSTGYVDSLMKNMRLPSFGHGLKDTFRIKNITVSLTPAWHTWQNEYGNFDRLFKREDYCGFLIQTADGLKGFGRTYREP